MWRSFTVTYTHRNNCLTQRRLQLPPFWRWESLLKKKKESQLDQRAAKWSRIHDSNKKRSLGRWLPLGMAVGTRSTRRLIGRCFFSPLRLLQCEDRDVLIAIRRKWSNSPYHCCYSHSKTSRRFAPFSGWVDLGWVSWGIRFGSLLEFRLEFLMTSFQALCKLKSLFSYKFPAFAIAIIVTVS